MAAALDYSVPAAPLLTADDELWHLLEVLHRSGTLRLLIGFFGRLGAVSETAIEEVNSAAGRNVLGAALFFGQVLAELPAEDLTAVARGLEAGFKAAERVADEAPASLLSLLHLAQAPDTRRALSVLLTIANRVGSQLGKSGRTGRQ